MRTYQNYTVLLFFKFFHTFNKYYLFYTHINSFPFYKIHITFNASCSPAP